MKNEYRIFFISKSGKKCSKSFNMKYKLGVFARFYDSDITIEHIKVSGELNFEVSKEHIKEYLRL
ncbi:hypothetical protein FDC58_10635 [Clostridium botulinum]|uniref:hypothetical protein n=1 Tax=unclassified Clostridium TaxID=2614128 RepID=UPI0005411A0C|nr:MULTISPECIES: hypothetical protein [unclassified Clostridium]AIY79899.1 hypothetical protein U728_1675 [Clostridium botulinum 202F]KAI3345008.1 hypothetical protein CIT17_15445 [Clostridium botulinum]KON14093.1 hypothetical protein ACP50_04080 [Clostridium botulinum]MBY6986425.1 hypothetical protein [Clostridium botulinum]MBY7009069.1 hypothetical protein [Clostridium botulinum]